MSDRQDAYTLADIDTTIPIHAPKVVSGDEERKNKIDARSRR